MRLARLFLTALFLHSGPGQSEDWKIIEKDRSSFVSSENIRFFYKFSETTTDKETQSV